MIIFGTCVGDQEKYETMALPSIRRVAAAGDLILARTGQMGICRPYNEFIAEARRRPDCSALVLMHEDVEIVDDNFRAKVLRALRDPTVGVAGVIGGSGLRDLAWWQARRTAGFVYETQGPIAKGDRKADVDALDGLLLIVSPAAFRAFAFDEVNFPRFNGYGFDYCLQVRKAGMRVVVTDIDILHRAKRTVADQAGWEAARVATLRKWPDYVLSSWPTYLREFKPMLRAIALANRAAFWAGWATARGHHFLADVAKRAIRHRSAVPWDDAHTAKELQARTRLHSLGRFVPDGALLEIGCDTGEFLSAAQAAGYEVYGSESDPSAARRARTSGARTTSGSLEDWMAEYPDMRVDALILWHGLGQIPDPPSFLLLARQILKARGKIVVEMPNDDQNATGLAELLKQTGFAVDCLLTVSSHYYETNEERQRVKNRALLDRAPWPALDSLLVVARVSDR